MTAGSLHGRRVLVVGASSGIGQAFAVRAVHAGAEVAMVARRSDALAATITEAGGGTAIVADLRNPDDCRRIADEALASIGAPELVLVAAGASTLGWVHETSAADWAVAFETNVIGVNLVFAALCPHLAPGAILAACSSESVGHPRAGLVTYGASKAALEETLRGWRLEHPQLRFSCIAVGATVPTDFANSWDPVMLGAAIDAWARHGLAQSDLMRTADVADVLTGTFAIALAYPGVGLEHLTLRSPAGVTADAELMRQAAAANGATG